MNRLLRLLLLFLIPSIPVQVVELLRDRHGNEEYVFEAHQTEMTATVDAAGATVIATDWATRFYDGFLSVENCEFRHGPIRFWLISFARSSGNEELYATHFEAELKGPATESCAVGTEEQPEKRS